MKNNRCILFAAACILTLMPIASAEEYHTVGIDITDGVLQWDISGEAELQRLSPDEDWATVYIGSDGSFRDYAPDGLTYYRVRSAGGTDWEYSRGIISGDAQETIQDWDRYEGNTSGSLDFTAKITEDRTLKIEKNSAYNNGDFGGISQRISADTLETGKRYTLRFKNRRVGGQTSYNQMYYSVGGIKTAITPSKGQIVDWRTVSKTVTCSDAESFDICFYVVGVGASMEIDDVVLYAEDDETQSNIVLNGDFESDAEMPAAPAYVAVLNSDAVISWECDNGIVVTDAVTEHPIAIFSQRRRIGSLKEHGDACVIRAYSGTGALSEPYMLSFSNSDIITEPVFSEKNEDGKVDISIKVKNVQREEGIFVGLYTALYRNGVLCSVNGIRQNIVCTKQDHGFEIMSSTCIIPDDTAVYQIKAFVWSGMDMIMPLTPAKSWKN